uniref:Uncharacterized protein n=1 Tax=Pristionchus pacificus TaxID=54126 RepID=A0A2A6BYZ2_PRIPA|eukprot:PDM71066.1 hypothetical protein PRIPAC_44462 [Pristionchus pacificus]
MATEGAVAQWLCAKNAIRKVTSSTPPALRSTQTKGLGKFVFILFQAVIDELYKILENKPELKVHIERVQALSDATTKLVVYVTQTGFGRVKATQLASFFQQPAKKAALEIQLKVDKDAISAVIAMDSYKKNMYLTSIPQEYINYEPQKTKIDDIWWPQDVESIKNLLTSLMDTISKDESLRNAPKNCPFNQENVVQLKKCLSKCQDGLESLFQMIHNNAEDTQMGDNGEEKIRAEKRARSEMKRLEAMRTKAELDAWRDGMVGMGLKDIDTESRRKKITFDSDSDNEGKEELITKRIKKEYIGDKWNKEYKLFGSDDDDNEDEIVFQNRHKGEKGIKLMEQEARYGNDERFKLNEKFDDIDTDEGLMDEQQKDVKGEKEGALSVLARVLGKEINREKIKDRKKKAMPFTRFDPDNEEHVKWMKDYTGIEPMGIWCEADSLQTRRHNLKEENEGDIREETGDKEEDSNMHKKIQVDGRQAPSMHFFFDVYSLSARSVVANFKRTQSVEKVKEKWSEQRESIVKTYKNQRRFAMKKEKDEKKGYGKKDGVKFKKNEEERVENMKKEK